MSRRIEFLSPRMVGPRFEGPAIPLEVLKDLAVLEEMVVEVAKWRYLEEHPDRKRSPRGFTDGISLKLTEIREGSAVAGISLFIATTEPFSSDNQTYLDQAKQRILGAIDAAENDHSITQHLPDRLLGYFDRLGRGLRDREAIEFDPENTAHPARLNKATRRKLLFASSSVQDLTEEVTLRGSIPEADQEKMTFHLQVINGPRVVAPIEAQHLSTVISAFNGYRGGSRVLLQGVGRFNRTDRLQSIVTVEHISVLEANDIGARLDELRGLKAGWLDGEGIAPSAPGLDWLAGCFEKYWPEDLPLPFLYPTVEGGIQAEWSLGHREISLEVDLGTLHGEWHDLDTESREETSRTVSLGSADGWGWLVERMKLSAESRQ